MQTFFTGEFELIVVQPDGMSDFVHVDESIKSQVMIPEKGISELDRLSAVVN